MLRPEAVALQGRTSEIEELLHRSVREDIAVTIDLPEDLWPVTVDPGEFELALLNIAVNARNALPKGGTFRLVARNTRCGGEPASGGLVGEFVAITLTDSGTGMPVEVMARAFEPYFTTKPAGLGSGLGLSQVYGFACQSRGSAVLGSAPGGGTAITLFLPRADAGPAMAGEIAAQPASAPGSARILLVEDDPRVAEATQDLLHNMGFDTRWAGDGPAALAFVENDPKLALVLSDVVMPGGVSGPRSSPHAARPAPRAAGQRHGRDVLQDPQGRTRLAHHLPEPDRSCDRNRPLHRRLLQSRPPPFGARLHQPASVRRAGSVKSKTLSTNAGQVQSKAGKEFRTSTLAGSFQLAPSTKRRYRRR